MNTDSLGKDPELDLKVGISDADHIRGDARAPLTLVEYGDFGCPFCARAYPVVKTLLAERAGTLRFVFRHNPRRGDHSLRAARAAEAAGLQGHFWDMHDMLFEHAEAFDETDLVAHASSLQLDVARFREDLASPLVATIVRQSELGGLRSRIVGTPTFFVNGRRFVDRPEIERLASAIDSLRACS